MKRKPSAKKPKTICKTCENKLTTAGYCNTCRIFRIPALRKVQVTDGHFFGEKPPPPRYIHPIDMVIESLFGKNLRERKDGVGWRYGCDDCADAGRFDASGGWIRYSEMRLTSPTKEVTFYSCTYCGCVLPPHVVTVFE